jgi:hypothetical protein
MAAEDDLRLAWHAHCEGRRGMRDALLTLAAASAGPGEAPWADRCRDRLVADHPDHLFARYSTRERALSEPQVLATLLRLRTSFPPHRVRWLLLKSAVARGAFTGRDEPLPALLDDLLAPAEIPAGVRRDEAQMPPAPIGLHRGATSRRNVPAGVGHTWADGPAARSGLDPSKRTTGFDTTDFDDEGPSPRAFDRAPAPVDPALAAEWLNFYLTLLLAMAVLLSGVLRPSPTDDDIRRP